MDDAVSDELRVYQQEVFARLNKALPKISQRRDDPESLHALAATLLNAAAHFAAMACRKQEREPRYEMWMSAADRLIRQSFEDQGTWLDVKAFVVELHGDGAAQWKLSVSAKEDGR